MHSNGPQHWTGKLSHGQAQQIVPAIAGHGQAQTAAQHWTGKLSHGQAQTAVKSVMDRHHSNGQAWSVQLSHGPLLWTGTICGLAIYC